MGCIGPAPFGLAEVVAAEDEGDAFVEGDVVADEPMAALIEGSTVKDMVTPVAFLQPVTGLLAAPETQLTAAHCQRMPSGESATIWTRPFWPAKAEGAATAGLQLSPRPLTRMAGKRLDQFPVVDDPTIPR